MLSTKKIWQLIHPWLVSVNKMLHSFVKILSSLIYYIFIALSVFKMNLKKYTTYQIKFE